MSAELFRGRRTVPRTPNCRRVLASPLQRSDEPSARQVRQAIATAIAAYGVRGCAARVAQAAWGRRAHRLEADPETAPVVRWMFAQRRAGHSLARITRALNDAGVPCPSASDPKRNPHRSGRAWTLTTVAAILANPRYTGRQVWNRQPTDFDLVDPATPGWGIGRCSGGTCPSGGLSPVGLPTRHRSARLTSSPSRR